MEVGSGCSESKTWIPSSGAKTRFCPDMTGESGLRRRQLPLPLRARHRKAFIALGCDLVADLPVRADAADIGHEDARLARHVGAHVPGIGLRIERGVGDLVDVGDPLFLGPLLRLDRLEAVLAYVGDAIADPVDMLLDRDDHVRQHRRAAGAGDEEEIGKARAHQAEIGFRPFRHFWFSVWPSRPRMSILATEPVMASNPVA